MANIYLRQMNELKVDVEQYSKLLDAPLFIVRRLVKGEKLSEDMGLNEFIRNNILKKYNDLEKNKVETQSKVVALKIDVDKKQNDLLEWHYNFDYQEFMKKHNLRTKDIYKNVSLGESTTKAIVSPLKKYKPTENTLRKIKKYVESFEEKEEKMEEIEIIDEDIIETLCETNTNIANSNEIEKLDTFIKKEEKCGNECLNDVLKNILKDRLTEEEKKLIEIFGGKVC